MALRVLATVTIVVVVLRYCWTKDEVDSSECPPWYYLSSTGHCVFSDKLPEIVNKFGNTSELQMGFCMTKELDGSLVVAQCPYTPAGNHPNFSLYHDNYHILPEDTNDLNGALCGQFNRRGFLCSECKEHHGIAAYRYYGLVCVKCTHSPWRSVAFIILLFGPTTVSFFVFLLFNINVHSGKLTGFIFFSHVIVSTVSFFPSLILLSQSQFGYWPVQILLSLYGVWSLNSLQFQIPPFCVSPHLTALQLISLGYVPSLYSLILCVLLYYLIESHDRGNWILVKAWEPFNRLFKRFKRSSNASYSVIYTFGTLILLSYGKNLFITFTLVQGFIPVELNPYNNTLRNLPTRSVDLEAAYFGPIHTPYAVLGIVGGLLTVFLPLVLVLIFPTRLFPKLIRCCGLRRWHGVRAFMEVFTGTYKDGTDARFGKTDYRFTASVYLCGRILLCVGCVLRGGNNTFYLDNSWLFPLVPFALAAVCFAYFQPHRRASHNAVDTLLLLLLAKLCFCFYLIFDTTTNKRTLHAVVLVLLIDLAIPQLALITYFSYKLVSWMCAQDVVRGLARGLTANRRHGNEPDRLAESQPLLAK